MVSNVSFGQKMGVFDKPDLDKPQSQARTNVTTEAKPDSVEVGGKKKHTAAKVIGGTVATVAVAAGLLALGKHFNAFDAAKVADLTKSFKDQKWISWAKEPAKKVLKGLDTAGDYILTKGKAACEWVKNIGKGKGDTNPDVTPDVGTPKA